MGNVRLGDPAGGSKDGTPFRGNCGEGREFDCGEREIGDAETPSATFGDRNPLHLDDDYARGTPFGGRVAHGALGIAVATGLMAQSGLTAGTLVALLGIDWRLPIRGGDRRSSGGWPPGGDPSGAATAAWSRFGGRAHQPGLSAAAERRDRRSSSGAERRVFRTETRRRRSSQASRSLTAGQPGLAATTR